MENKRLTKIITNKRHFISFILVFFSFIYQAMYLEASVVSDFPGGFNGGGGGSGDKMTNNPLGGGTTSVIDTRHTVGGSVTLKTGEKTLSEINALNTNWQDTNDALGDATKEWSRTNDSLDTLTDPVSLGILAASAASGAIIGIAAANLAIGLVKYGVKSLYTFLHEAITHDKENQELIEDFLKASQSYEISLVAAQKYEENLVNLLRIQEALTEADLLPDKESVLFSLGVIISFLEYRALSLKEDKELAFQNKNLSSYINFDSDFQKSISQMKKLNKLRDDLSAVRMDGDLCQYLPKMYYELVLQESKLQEFRTNILAAKREWFERFKKHRNKQIERIDKTLDDASRIYWDGKTSVKKYVKNHIRKIKRDKESFIGGCILTLKEEKHSKSFLKTMLIQKQEDLFNRKKNSDSDNFSGGLRDLFRRIFKLKNHYRIEICENNFELEVLLQNKELRSLKDYFEYEKKRAARIKAKIEKTHLNSLKTILENPSMIRDQPESYAEAIEAHLVTKFDLIAKDAKLYNAKLIDNCKLEDKNCINAFKNKNRLTNVKSLFRKLEELCPSPSF